MKMLTAHLFCISTLCTTVLGCGKPQPSQIASTLPVVGAGFETTCVTGAEHRLTCYGSSVGDGTSGPHTSPAAPAIGLVKAFALSASLPFGCAIAGDPGTGPAGPVWCWIGNGTPTNVQGISDAVNISVGGPGACAVLASDRSVRCWSLSNPFNTPDYLSAFFPQTPSLVRGLQNGIAQISVGEHFACAVSAGDQQVYCWGRNDTGQLGRGTVSAATDPELDASIPVTNLAAKQVSAGNTHACAIATDNTVKCWGDSSSGQLGNGTNTSMYVPTPQTASGITNAVNVGTSAGFSCATLSDRTARCWGDNLSGTLGVGLLISAATPGSVEFKKPGAANMPLPVKGLTGAIFISTGATHACASGLPAVIHCWGGNNFGQLADGTTKDSLEPVTP